MATLASIHGDPDSGMRPSVATFHPYMIKPQAPRATPGLLASLGFRPVKEATDGK